MDFDQVIEEELSLLRRPTGISGLMQRLEKSYPNRLTFKKSGNDLVIYKSGSRRKLGLKRQPQHITIIKDGGMYIVHRSWKWNPKKNCSIDDITHIVEAWLSPNK